MVDGKFIEMQTEIMKNYPPANAQALLNIYNTAEEMQAYLDTMLAKTRESYLYTQLRDIVENYYDIGKLDDVYQIFGGYINTSFGIYTEKNGEKQTWFIRKYKSGKELESLLFEHSMLRHAQENGFTYGAVPIAAIDGKTYHATKEVTSSGENESYFAIFNFVDGKAHYDWIPNWANDGVADITITSAAKSLAEFHNSTRTFDPEGRHGDNIMDNEDITVNEIIRKFPKTLKAYRKHYAEAGFENVYTEYYDANYSYFSKMCERSVIPPADYNKMVSNVCHCDFHPGNFKYLDNGEVCGSFDYDMAKIDSRLFELGLALHYCFASWKSECNGTINLDYAITFIKTYDDTLRNAGGLEPLNETEKKYLYEVTVQGALYDLGWCSSACVYDSTLDPYEYLFYTQHFVACLKWLEENEETFRNAFK
ncbi:MAG: phosphotransferase [Eubacterium sp.]